MPASWWLATLDRWSSGGRRCQLFLCGLWASGIRLGELGQLSWDDDAAICFDLTGQIPMVRTRADAEKAHTGRQ